VILTHLPFKEAFRADMVTGRKTATSRTHKYGNPGDSFWAFGVLFDIKRVSKLPLSVVAEKHYQAEGFESPEAFRSVWVSLHPRKGWQPEQLVWFHEFEMVRWQK